MKLIALLLLLVPLSAYAQDTDPLLEITFDEQETIPGQPLTLRLTVFVPTFMPTPPVWPSFETPNLRIRLPEKSTSPTSRTINGDTWSGISRRYQVTPVVPGTFSLPASVLKVTYRDPEGGPELKIDLPIEEMAVTGILPEGAEGLSPFVAATQFDLTQTIDGTTEDMDAGQSFARVLTAEVEGVSPYFLPQLTPDGSLTGLRAYPETPAIEERDNRGLLSGERMERTVYLAETATAGELPEVSIDWYNLKTGKIETASAETIPVSSKDPPPPPKASFQWQQALPYAAGLVALGFALWLWNRWMAAPFANWRARRRATHLASEAYAYKQLQKACKARDMDMARTAFEVWFARSAVSATDKSAITQAFLDIGRARFGAGGSRADSQPWQPLEKVISDARHSRHAGHAVSALPPLNP